MQYYFITNNLDLALYAIKSGVTRIFIDLEKNGKHLRQKGFDTLISSHYITDIYNLKDEIKPNQLMVRINPIHQNSKEEIEDVINAGAGIIMLPMFRTLQEVNFFIDCVSGRVKTNLLFETLDSINLAKEILDLKGVDEVHIGLNDLHLDMRVPFMFQPVVDGTLDLLIAGLREKRIPFGIGGIARIGIGDLPAELVLVEHVRLGSTAVILSRSFHNKIKSLSDVNETISFPKEILKLNEQYDHLQNKTEDELNKLHDYIVCEIKRISNLKSSKKYD